MPRRLTPALAAMPTRSAPRDAAPARRPPAALRRRFHHPPALRAAPPYGVDLRCMLRQLSAAPRLSRPHDATDHILSKAKRQPPLTPAARCTPFRCCSVSDCQATLFAGEFYAMAEQSDRRCRVRFFARSSPMRFARCPSPYAVLIPAPLQPRSPPACARCAFAATFSRFLRFLSALRCAYYSADDDSRH